MHRRSILAGSAALVSRMEREAQAHGNEARGEIRALPPPRRTGRNSLEECLSRRRSIREYKDLPLSTADIAQLLWAAQGVTSADRRRTAPSAGALYPLETYLVAGTVEGIAPGVYRYGPEEHSLRQVATGDRRRQIAHAALSQDFLGHAAAEIVLAAVYRRTTGEYGQRGLRYVHMEAGHAAQNVCLEATALGLGCVPVGAFDETGLRQLMQLSADEVPLYLLPIAHAL